MHSKYISLTTSLLVSIACLVPGVSAEEKHDHDEEEHRHHKAHMHGVAELNLALEDQEVHIEFDSPAANIVGFEHAPKSKADHSALDNAVATLKNGDSLFGFNKEAGCQMEAVHVTSALLAKGQDEHADDYDHEEHEKEHKAHGEEETTHSDIQAAYHFECDQPAKLTQLNVGLFSVFPSTEELKVQYVIGSKQGAKELSAKDHIVDF